MVRSEETLRLTIRQVGLVEVSVNGSKKSYMRYPLHIAYYHTIGEEEKEKTTKAD
jgi:hypothetical protein